MLGRLKRRCCGATGTRCACAPARRSPALLHGTNSRDGQKVCVSPTKKLLDTFRMTNHPRDKLTSRCVRVLHSRIILPLVTHSTSLKVTSCLKPSPAAISIQHDENTRTHKNALGDSIEHVHQPRRKGLNFTHSSHHRDCRERRRRNSIHEHRATSFVQILKTSTFIPILFPLRSEPTIWFFGLAEHYHRPRSN